MAPDEAHERMWEEIDKLRNWRHSVAVPELASLRGRLQAAEVTISDLEPKVERLARADEVADAVKAVVWKAAAALGAVIVGTATVAGVIIAYFH